MSAQSWYELSIAALALLAMALAATISMIVPPMSRQRHHQIVAQRRADGRSVEGLLAPNRSLTTSLLIVEILSAIVATSMLSALFRRGFDAGSYFFPIALVLIGFLIFGQAMPRALARRRPDQVSSFVRGVAQVLVVVVRPLLYLVDQMASAIGKVFPAHHGSPVPIGEEDELRRSLRPGDDGVIDAEEQLMIDGILRLEELTAREIMVPRLDIIAVSRSVPPRGLVQTIVGAGHSRIPVFDESIDQIIGILYAKDLLPFVVGNTDRLPLLDLIRPAIIVPESKRLDRLLSEMQRDRIHIAIVADEYGGTAGLLTIEDILEEIVGEIHDEYDTGQPLFEQVSETELIADGRLPLEEVAEALRVSISEDDDFDTLGGFVHK
ncbi:MAG: hemolysin family protein, partial [Chloroflexota bacterium]|nr:hemolysin family protein [Chloroflexota bacterium]